MALPSPSSTTTSSSSSPTRRMRRSSSSLLAPRAARWVQPRLKNRTIGGYVDILISDAVNRPINTPPQRRPQSYLLQCDVTSDQYNAMKSFSRLPLDGRSQAHLWRQDLSDHTARSYIACGTPSFSFYFLQPIY